MQIDAAVGGYFSRESPSQRPALLPWMKNAKRFQSARAAFVAVLISARPRAIWMPDYICADMIEAATHSGVPIKLYSPNPDLGVPDLTVATDEWLLVVNYFGLHSANVDDALKRFSPTQVIVDQAQALYAPPPECLAVLYSIRKFFGVADGGLLVGAHKVNEPTEMDSGSVERGRYLNTRLKFGPEAGYAEYRAAEHSLSGLPPLRLSDETQSAVAKLDVFTAAETRRANFEHIFGLLGQAYAPIGSLGPHDVPLCYPITSGSLGLRQFLVANRIFTPTYWPGIRRASSHSLAEDIASRIVALPIDQRYGFDDMQRVAEVVLAY